MNNVNLDILETQQKDVNFADVKVSDHKITTVIERVVSAIARRTTTDTNAKSVRFVFSL